MRRIGIVRFLFGSDYNVLTPGTGISKKRSGRVIGECKRQTANRGNGDDQAMKKSEEEKNSLGKDNHLATGIAIGIAIGAGIGAALHNLSQGIDP